MGKSKYNTYQSQLQNIGPMTAYSCSCTDCCPNCSNCPSPWYLLGKRKAAGGWFWWQELHSAVVILDCKKLTPSYCFLSLNPVNFRPSRMGEGDKCPWARPMLRCQICTKSSQYSNSCWVFLANIFKVIWGQPLCMPSLEPHIKTVFPVLCFLAVWGAETS